MLQLVYWAQTGLFISHFADEKVTRVNMEGLEVSITGVYEVKFPKNQ